jgi:hypothetical protein
MKQRTRICYSEADKALMWERWRQGESLNSIARLFGRNHSARGRIPPDPRQYAADRSLASVSTVAGVVGPGKRRLLPLRDRPRTCGAGQG